jgi:D-arabinose 1-dehydrogenase-like Zn-dependent alcohol dehydrogenase
MLRQSLVEYGSPLVQTESPLPSPAGGEVLLKVSHCGLCHSDLHLIDGHFDLGQGKLLDIREGRALPFTLGHEICGHVVAHGPDVLGLSNGRKLYAIYPWIGCGKCSLCLDGDEHLCDRPHHLGVHSDGGFATHVLVPHPRYLIDAEGIEPALSGSLMCSGLTAYSALKKAIASGRDGSLLVIGLGGVGHMAFELARAITMRRIAVADISAAKREAALAGGAEMAVDPALPDARRALKEEVGPIAAVLDFVGSEQSLTLAQGAVGKAGTVVVVGLMGGRFSIPAPLLPLRHLSILGSFVGSLPEARELVGLVRQGRVRSIPIEERDLSQANQAVSDLRAGNVIGRVSLRSA